jgi:hypothetical protein
MLQSAADTPPCSNDFHQAPAGPCNMDATKWKVNMGTKSKFRYSFNRNWRICLAYVGRKWLWCVNRIGEGPFALSDKDTHDRRRILRGGESPGIEAVVQCSKYVAGSRR